MRRRALLVLLLATAALSFGLSIWSALQGRLPVVEMAHALLFAFLAMVVAAAPQRATGCRECGHSAQPGFGFCIGCGRIARDAGHAA